MLSKILSARNLGYAGATAVAVASYFLSTWVGLLVIFVGAMLMLPQAIKLKAWNIVILNSVAGFGYLVSMWSILN